MSNSIADSVIAIRKVIAGLNTLSVFGNSLPFTVKILFDAQIAKILLDLKEAAKSSANDAQRLVDLVEDLRLEYIAMKFDRDATRKELQDVKGSE
jgi:hypothetical protein